MTGQEWRVRTAMKSGLDEVPRSSLTFGRFGHIEHEDGRFYRAIRGQVDDPQYSSAIAFYITKQGDPVYLEPAAGPKSRDELAAKQAEREQRRAAQANAVPAWRRR